MAFPTSPIDGQVYNRYKYNATKNAWLNNIETYVRSTPTTVPTWAVTIISGDPAILLDATGKVPADAIAIELRVWMSSSVSAIYNYIEWGTSAESVTGSGKNPAIGGSNIVVDGFSHYTIKVYLGTMSSALQLLILAL